MTTYTSKYSFHWSSDLTDDRKAQILAWVASLPRDELSLLEDVIADATELGWEAGASTEIGADI